MEQLLNRFVHFLEEIQTSGDDNDSGEHFKEIKVRLDSTSSCSSSSASPPGPRARERSDTISSLHEGLIAEELSDNDSRYLRKLFANDSNDSSNGRCCGTTATTP